MYANSIAASQHRSISKAVISGDYFVFYRRICVYVVHFGRSLYTINLFVKNRFDFVGAPGRFAVSECNASSDANPNGSTKSNSRWILAVLCCWRGTDAFISTRCALTFARPVNACDMWQKAIVNQQTNTYRDGHDGLLVCPHWYNTLTFVFMFAWCLVGPAAQR